MNILKHSKNQFKINGSISVVEKNNVVYTAHYKDIGNGYSDVKCTIKTLYNNQEHSFDLSAKIPNALIKNDKPVIMPVNNQGKDGIAFVFPEGQNSGKREYSILSFNNYQIDIGVNSIKTTHLNKKVLSNNAKLSHSSNKYHSYNKPKAIELPNGDIMIAAVDSNSEGQYVTAWLLEKEQEFEVNKGPKRSTNRLLFKIDENAESDFQFLSANQNNNIGKIIYSDSTSLFSLDITRSMIDDIRDGKYVNNGDEECLFAVGKERCDQFDKKVPTPFLTTSEVSNLTAVNSNSGVIVTFLEKNGQQSLAKLTGKKGEKPKKHIIHNYEEPIKSLQLSMTNKDSVMISAVGEKNVIQSSINLTNLNEVAVKNFPIDEIKTLGDFIDIIYNNPLKLMTSFPYTTFSSITSDSPQISSEANTISSETTTSPLVTIGTKEITTRESTITVEENTTSAATTEITTQYTTMKPKTTQYPTIKLSTTEATTQLTTEFSTPKTITATEKTTTSTKSTTTQIVKSTETTMSPSTAGTTRSTTVTSPKTVTSTERATAKAKTSIMQHTTAGQSTAVTTTSTAQPTTVTPFKITTSTEKTTISTGPTTNQATKAIASTTKSTTKPTKATAKSTVRSTSYYTTGTERDSTTVTGTDLPKSRTSEVQSVIAIDSTTALGLTTLASTIGSAIITTLAPVTQSTTNTLTIDNYPMITDHISNFNQTDESSSPAGRSLNTAEISGIALAGVIGIGLTLYACYYRCCRSNIRLPSDYTDDIGLLQRLRGCFNRQRRTTNEIQLESLGGYSVSQENIHENEINQNSASNSKEDLLKQNQSGATYSTFSPASNANSEAGRSRSNSQKSTNSEEWDHQYDTNSVQYEEEDKTIRGKINVNSSNTKDILDNSSRRSSGDGASLAGSDGEMSSCNRSNSHSNSEVQNVDNLQLKPRSNVKSVNYTYDESTSSSRLTNVEIGPIEAMANETVV